MKQNGIFHYEAAGTDIMTECYVQTTTIEEFTEPKRTGFRHKAFRGQNV